MSRSMIEVVQRACECWGHGDLAPLYDLYTADVTADPDRLWFESGGSVTGADAVVSGFASLIGAFERNELYPEGAIEAGETIVVPLLWRGLAPGSTTFVEQRMVGVFTFREQKIASMTWFPDLAEALEYVGLPPAASEQMIVLARPGLAGEAP